MIDQLSFSRHQMAELIVLFCRNKMRSIAAVLLFPYLLPLVAISALVFAWMLVTPNDPTVLGPTGSDVLGLYFMMLNILIGGVAQAVIGIPFCLLLKWIGSPIWRGLLAVVAVTLALIPFAYVLTESPHTIPQFVGTLVVVVGCFSVGVWIPIRTFRPD